MAAKKGKKPAAAKKMGKKDLKRTKGGILIALNQPALSPQVKVELGGVTTTPPTVDWKIKW